MEIDKASLHKKIAQLPGYVKTNILETSKFIMDRELTEGAAWKAATETRQEQRTQRIKDLKHYGFSPEKGILDKMELLSGLLHCGVGVKAVNSWYKNGIFEGSEEIKGLIKNLAEDLRHQELYRSRLPPEGPVR